MSEEQRIRQVVEHREGPVLAVLKTAGHHVFVAEDGTVHRAARWVVATPRHCWLVAVSEDDAFRWATGEIGDVRLETGWTRDRLVVGPWWLPLRSRTRSAAQALIEAFTAAGGGGAPLRPPDGPQVPAVARAKGALGLPDGLPVPGQPSSERWLVGLPLVSTHPFNHHRGVTHDSPWMLLVSTHRTLAVAMAPWGEAALQSGDRFDVTMPSAGRPTLTLDGRDFLAPTGARAAVAELYALHALPSPGARWQLAAQTALEAPDPARALALLAEARELGEAAHPGLPEVAAMAWALDQGDGAARAWAAAAGLPDDPVEWATRVESQERPLRRALKRANVKWSTLRSTLGLDTLPPVDRPEGLPWPAERYTEAMAAGLVSRATDESVTAAIALWETVEESPRRLAGLAALRGARDAADGRATWREAASAHAAQGDHDLAMAALRRAMAAAPTADDHAQLARWALAAKADPAPHWAAAVRADPSGAFAYANATAAEWTSLLPATEGAPGARAVALAAIVAETPSIAGYEALATAYERLDRPHDAARALMSAAERADAATVAETPEPDDPHPDAPRFERWVRIAALQARAQRPDDVHAALTEAVTGDFLVPDAYSRALAVQAPIPDALRTWWVHLRDVLGTTPPPPHHRWVDGFDNATLDALHPGGIGWLDRLQQSIDPSDPPDRTGLVRGLERLTAAAWPREHAQLTAVCKVLGMAVPEAFVYRGEGAWGVSAWPSDPRVLLVGIEHLQPGERHLDDAALAFALAVELAHLRCGHPILAMDQNLVGTSRSVYSAFGRYATTAENVFDLITLLPGIDQITKLQSLFRLGRRMFAARSVLDKATDLASPLWDRLTGGGEGGGGIGRENLQGAGLKLRMHADRVALLVTGDLHAAIRAILTASTKSASLLGPIAEDGLLSVLTTDRMPVDEALRITELIAFAARQRPDRRG